MVPRQRQHQLHAVCSRRGAEFYRSAAVRALSARSWLLLCSPRSCHLLHVRCRISRLARGDSLRAVRQWNLLSNTHGHLLPLLAGFLSESDGQDRVQQVRAGQSSAGLRQLQLHRLPRWRIPTRGWQRSVQRLPFRLCSSNARLCIMRPVHPGNSCKFDGLNGLQPLSARFVPESARQPRLHRVSLAEHQHIPGRDFVFCVS
jgi:hypothetical protein